MRQKIIYKETYRRGTTIKQERQPVCRHQAEGAYLKRAELLCAGSIEVDGEVLEFHDVRLFFTDKPLG